MFSDTGSLCRKVCFDETNTLQILEKIVPIHRKLYRLTLEFVENFTSSIGDKLLGYARSLFVALATLSLALGLGKIILSGESNIGSVAAHVAKWIIYRKQARKPLALLTRATRQLWG